MTAQPASLSSAAPWPLFDWLKYDQSMMTEARRVLASPDLPEQPFAIGVRVTTIEGEVYVASHVRMWWWKDDVRLSDCLPFSVRHAFKDVARTLSPLALWLTGVDGLGAEIAEFLPRSAIGDLHFHGHFYIAAQGAFLIRDMATNAIERDGGHSHVFPILPTPPDQHARLAQLDSLQSAIRKILLPEASILPLSKGSQYRLIGGYEV